MQEINSHKFASVIAKILDNKLAKDITILNIANVSVLADYFVICTADSPTQVRALTGYTKEQVKEVFERIPVGVEQDQKNRWNLLDYGDVVVHILHKEEREMYAIEKFWNHACQIEEEVWQAESKEFEGKLK